MAGNLLVKLKTLTKQDLFVLISEFLIKQAIEPIEARNVWKVTHCMQFLWGGGSWEIITPETLQVHLSQIFYIKQTWIHWQHIHSVLSTRDGDIDKCLSSNSNGRIHDDETSKEALPTERIPRLLHFRIMSIFNLLLQHLWTAMVNLVLLSLKLAASTEKLVTETRFIHLPIVLSICIRGAYRHSFIRNLFDITWQRKGFAKDIFRLNHFQGLPFLIIAALICNKDLTKSILDWEGNFLNWHKEASKGGEIYPARL